jgi:hypothetical protein
MATHRARSKGQEPADRARADPPKPDRRSAQEQKINRALAEEAARRERGSGAEPSARGSAHSNKASRADRRSEKAAAAGRRAPPKPPEKRRVGLRLTFAAVVIVLIAASAVAVSRLTEKVNSVDTSGALPVLSATALRQLTHVPAAALDDVGAGSARAVLAKVKAPALTEDGRPRFLVVGAESCAPCAAERWPIVVALSRFGTWSGLTATLSPATELYPNTPTLTFHGATYTSRYLSFTGVETEGRVRENGVYPPLDTLSPEDARTFETVNTDPYVPAQSVGAIPFLDLAGRYVGVGSQFGTQLLGGNTHDQIAAALSQPTSYLARAINGSANVLTAAICQVLGERAPGKVCTTTAVLRAKGLLKSR